MISRTIKSASLSYRTRIFVRDDTTFMGKTGLIFSDIDMSYSGTASDTNHDLVLVSGTIGGAFLSASFKEVDAVKQPGIYQFDTPNIILVGVAGSEATLRWRGAGILDDGIEFKLTNYNGYAIDKTDFSLSAAGLAAIWDKLLSSMVTVGSVGKSLSDNLAATKTDTAAIKVKTDSLLQTSGRVEIAPHGLDNVIGYHPAGDA